MAEENLSARDRVIEYLNKTSFLPSEKEKVDTLAKVQELVIHFDRTLLDAFYEEIVAFQNDRNADVRNKNDHAMLPRLVPNICLLLQDQAVSVVKRVVQAASQLLRSTLLWLSSARVTTKEMEQTWEIMCSIKGKIIKMIDHDNDGSVLQKLVDFQGSLHISSVNLMTCMSSLSILARARPQFMGRVIEALEILHANLPPTLTKSQVNSVRKHLKIQLLNLLRHTAAYEYHDNIITILNDLNASSSEINKAMPSKEEIKRYLKRSKPHEDRSSAEAPKKKPRLDKADASTPRSEDTVTVSQVPEKLTSIDITQRWLQDKLKIDVVANLVMVTMLNLPDNMPALFSVAYTPVTAAGSTNQVQHVARLLSSQLTAAGLGPGAEQQELKNKEEKEKGQNEESDEEEPAHQSKIPRLVGRLIQENKKENPTPLLPAAMVSRPVFQRAKFLKLAEVTKPLSEKSSMNLQLVLLKVLLKAEKLRLYGESHKNRLRIIAKFTTTASYEELVELESFIFEDLNGNLELLQSWIYSVYSSTYNLSPLSKLTSLNKAKGGNEEFCSFEKFLLHILEKLFELPANKERDDILSKLLLDCPTIPVKALHYLNKCGEQGEETTRNVTQIIKDIIFLRPNSASACLNVLCSLATHSHQEIRLVAEELIQDLHSEERLRESIAEISGEHLGYLMEEKPSEELFDANLGRPNHSEDWTEEAVRACLYLTLAILPKQQELIHHLAQVYVKTVNEAKRTILRYLEAPISHMGMDSPTLLSLVETCPKGSETLITRIIHILTEKAPPSEELVSRVKELYNKRVSDVRFLIPVLTGLTKKEVIAVLPKLIKLNPHVVKEVFNRLWGVTLDKGTSPLSPVDLLVALHLISPEKCDVKTIIKATGLCFAERNIYTAEALAVVLQQLLEQPSLPTLFMRTVIQTLTHYPKLLSFIMNVLQRLITKQVWKQRKAWEGFIKCCQRSVPQSFNVLLQLPPPQLAEALIEAPDLQTQLSSHLNTLTEAQRAHIPTSLLEVIENPRIKEVQEGPDNIAENGIKIEDINS
ncbi:Symplekin [Armadillidium vulgare]|nr:Symplekin [Armadillidium vulgare]